MSDQQIENGEPRVITDSEGLMAQFVEVQVERDIIPVYCAFYLGTGDDAFSSCCSGNFRDS